MWSSGYVQQEKGSQLASKIGFEFCWVLIHVWMFRISADIMSSGHHAEVCSSSERLCYNCKAPGHESNACPLPRTTESKLASSLQSPGVATNRIISQAMLSLPGSWTRAERLPNPETARRRCCGWWARRRVLQLWASRSSGGVYRSRPVFTSKY